MGYAKIFIHAVWSTKAWYPYLSPEVKEKLLAHITGQAREKGVHIDCINGYADHVQCLLSLEPYVSIGQAMQVLMHDSALWANREKITKIKFEWASDYYASSVCEAHLNTVRRHVMREEQQNARSPHSEAFQQFLEEFRAKGG